jgi:putative membrane protein insertion efficiency factor
MESLKFINLALAYPLIALVWLYQQTLSPDHSWLRRFFPYGYCKFHPSCSMYALKNLQMNGLLAIPAIIKRVLSCNPFTKGGFDYPVKYKALIKY